MDAGIRKNQIVRKVQLAGLFLLALLPRGVSASTYMNRGVEAARPDGAPTTIFGSNGVFETIADTLLYVLGAVAVIMLIIGGFRYVVSGGDSSSIESAKNTILYAIIGIIVAFLAYAAVSFVVGQLESGTTPTPPAQTEQQP